jgi:hypothetical protein
MMGTSSWDWQMGTRTFEATQKLEKIHQQIEKIQISHLAQSVYIVLVSRSDQSAINSLLNVLRSLKTS